MCAAALTAASVPAWAQQPDGLRTAGDATRFRVIQRIPTTKRPVVEKVDWPFPPEVEKAVAADDWDAAWKALDGAKPPEDERFAFLWAWIALGAGENDAAQPVFEKLSEGTGLFVDYASLYAGEAAFRAGRWEQAAAHAARVPSDAVAYRSASLLLGRALLRQEDKSQGRRALQAFVDAFPGDDDAPLARTELARDLHAQGKHLAAAELLTRVRRETPFWSGIDEPFTALEKEVHEALSKSDKKKVLVRRADDWLTEYRVRFRAHESEKVAADLAKVVEGWPKKSTERCEALYMIGNSFTKLRKHSDSIPWYDKTIAECDGEFHRRALYKAGKAYWNAGRKDEALETYATLAKEYAKHSYADDALFFSSRILREKDQDEKAKALLKRQVREYPDGDMAPDAHWLLMREMFEDEKYDDVVAYVDEQKDPGESDLYSAGRLKYFRARAMQKSGKADAAKAAYQAVVRDYPMSYYSLFALNRLAEMRGGNTSDVCAIAEGAICATIPVASASSIGVDDELKSSPEFRRGKAFLQIALDGFAQLEFKRLRNRAGENDDRKWAIAALLDAAGAYPYSHDIARRHIDGWEDEYPDRDHAVKWAVGYPTPFDDEVGSWSKKRGLPEALLWAIMREESGFNPRVRSWAGAIGLMQLMPGTAKMMAEKDAVKYDESALRQPDTAVRLGSAYLDDLAERSDTHPVLVIAGYNGGWGNVSRWLDDPDSRDLDLWVEDIPYGQTRDYTKRVLRSFWVYSWMYGDERVPRFDLTAKKGA